MTMEQLRDVCQARPFGPFAIPLTDGRSVFVAHRELLSRSPSGRIAMIDHADKSFSVVDLPLVDEIEIHTHATAPATDDGKL